MSDESLSELEASVRLDIDRARALLPTPPTELEGSIAQLTEWLELNELELAISEMERLGNDNTAPPRYWNRLRLAARRMGLNPWLTRQHRILTELHVGGLIAMGYDPSGDYLLTISGSGRGVFSTRTWERVARDPEPAYPENGHGIGIGPIAGASVAVTEMNYATEELAILSPDESVFLEYDSGTITVSEG